MATNKKAASTKKKTSVKSSATSRTSATTVKTVSATTKKQSLGQHVESSLKSRSLWRSLAAEFIGTFLLAAVIIAGQGQPIFVLFALVGIVLLIGGISGGHVNPAITIGAWATRRIGWLRAVGYILVQFLGAAVAFFTLNAFLGGAGESSAQQSMMSAAPSLFAANDLSALEGKEMFVLFSEILGTAILALAIAHATRIKDALTAAFTAGTGILIALMVAITAAGYVAASAIMNPAVALALQAFSDANYWAYIAYMVGPVIGGVLGFVIYNLLQGKKN